MSILEERIKREIELGRRGTCHICGKQPALRRVETMRGEIYVMWRHRFAGIPCPGSGKQPKQAPDGE